MKVSLVTCTFNRADQLRRGLLTVINQRVLPQEIILVNDGSIDHTESVANELQKLCELSNIKFKYIYLDHPEPRISCIPRNIGIKQATGDVIIFTESEALHVGSTIKQLLTKLEENPNSVILASQVWTMGQRIQAKINPEDFTVPARLLSHPYAMLVDGNMQNTKAPDSDFAITGEANCNAGVLFAVRKQWLLDCGGFDETFTGHGFDDLDLFNRLGHMGHPLLKCSDIATIHQWHRKDYPYNIYEHAERNGKISEDNIKNGRYVANLTNQNLEIKSL